MIPLRDALPARETPRVTITVVAVLALVFTGVWSSSDPVELLIVWGVAPAASLWPEAIAAPWMHGGLVPVVASGWAIWLFGESVEDRLGGPRFALLVVSCAAAGTFAHAAVHPGSRVPVVGAGVLAAGVIGAYLRLYPHGRLLAFAGQILEVPAAVAAATWLLVQAFDSGGLIAPGALVRGWSLAALAGSAAVGAGAAALLDRSERARVEWYYREG